MAALTVKRVAAYTLLWLLLADLSIGIAWRLPRDPRVEPSMLQRYFDYGRSVEAKLHAMIGPTRETSAPIMLAGWLDPNEPVSQPSRPSKPENVLVAAYGQSFTLQIMDALQALDPHFETRVLGGPGAPLSHSFALYRMDRGRHDANVVVIGVLASALPLLTSMTNMTWWFEAPQPATYPRFFLRGGKLDSVEPSVRTFEDLKRAVNDPDRWRRFIGELKHNDAAYSPWLFEHDLFDWSSLARTARRGYGQKLVRDFRARFVDTHGFVNCDHVLDIAEAILAEFATSVSRDGKMPYIVLINDRGFDDYLFRALGPRIERHGIPYFSTHEIAPAKHQALFLNDGHFRPEVNRALASALHEALAAEIAKHHDFGSRIPSAASIAAPP